MRKPCRGTALATCAALALLMLTSAVSAADGKAPDVASPAAKAIDLNTATAAELVEVPGIGETMAQRIVDWREEHGPFRRVDDLMKVKGIGAKSLEKLRSHVTVADDD